MEILKIKSDKLEKCSLCNFCRAGCPIFLGSEKEIDSPRSKAIELKFDKPTENSFYKCTLCGYCKQICPNKVDMDMAHVREELVNSEIETESNKKMIENVRKYGNPFGKTDDDHSKDKEYYCC